MGSTWLMADSLMVSLSSLGSLLRGDLSIAAKGIPHNADIWRLSEQYVFPEARRAVEVGKANITDALQKMTDHSANAHTPATCPSPAVPAAHERLDASDASAV